MKHNRMTTDSAVEMALKHNDGNHSADHHRVTRPHTQPDLASQPRRELFGIWKDHKGTENVEWYVRRLRKGRELC